MIGKRKFDYKWVIVALCFLMVFTALGFCSSNKSLYLGAITGALDIKRGAFALNDSFRFVTTAVVNIFFGALVKKLGLKKLICAGFISLISSVLIYATATEVWHFYIGGMLLGIGFAWTTTTIVGSVIGKWCPENKGTILGAVLASNGLGGALAAQIMAPIIYEENNPFGYRNAYFIIAAILLAVGIIVMIFFKNDPPQSAGKTDEPAAKKTRGRSWAGITFAEAKGKAYFWVSLVCILFTGLILQSVNGVAATHMKDVGMDTGYVATVLSIHSISLAFLKFLTGILYDKKGLRLTMTICNIAAILVMIALAFAANSPAGNMVAMFYAVVSGLALPLETVMLPIYAGDLFGEKDFNKMLGIFVSVNVTGYAIGAPLANLCYDIFGSYVPIFFASAVVMAAVAVVMQFVLTAANRQKAGTTAKQM